MSVEELNNKLVEELEEQDFAFDSEDDEQIYKETLDIINVALMLAKRLKQNV